MCYTNEPIHTEDFNGYTIEIHQDQDAYHMNPADDTGFPPIAVSWLDHGRMQTIQEYATQYGSANTAPTLTREQIKANLSDILSMLEEKSIFALRDSSYHPDIVSIVNDRLSEHLAGLNNSDRLEALCDIWKMAGIPAICVSISGYSQGDYAEVLAVATKEFQDACGNDAEYWKDDANLKSCIKEYRDWAFGNVYGYVVKDETGEEIEDGSCWGFIGDYDAPFGAVHEAQAAVNWDIAKRRKDRIESVKTWIKNRVPLYARQFAR